MIEIISLSKQYGKKKALDNISFSVSKGEILGFLGPNGAGKSTTMNIITGYLSSTSGTVTVDGYDILDNPNEVKRRIGYLPEQPPLYADMTVEEYLDFVFDLKKIKGISKKEHIGEIVEKVGISEVYKRRISHLSKGYKQRVGLAQALLGNPEVLILDEPTVGLDPNQIIEIRNVIKELGKEHTVILSSHILSEISAVCERVIIIKDGRIVAEDTPENLSKAHSKAVLSQRVMGEKNAVTAAIKDTEGVVSVRVVGEADGAIDVEVEADGAVDAEFSKKLFFVLANSNMPILMQKTVEATLEDVFIEITQNDIPEDYTEPEAVIGEKEEVTDESDI
ncbi:MAG: ATP-binding cassette domain-containing protein [Clostridia bacterium]|nr:ATP-binding cassette domain-containing protein [Clostridia bacterium]